MNENFENDQKKFFEATKILPLGKEVRFLGFTMTVIKYKVPCTKVTGWFGGAILLQYKTANDEIKDYWFSYEDCDFIIAKFKKGE